MYELLVERSRRAAREYYRTRDPAKYREMIMYESIDMDSIPDYIEEIDLNPRTTWYRFNYPYETFIIGGEKRQYFPYI